MKYNAYPCDMHFLYIRKEFGAYDSVILGGSGMDYTLYVCTDRRLMSSPTIEESVEQAVIGGAGVIQLRDKEASARQMYETALSLKRITDYYHVPLIINDRVDIAAAVDAAGVHLGQSDMPLTAARRILGKDKIIGVSAARVEEAVLAEQEGADYLGVGAMFVTGTKTNTRPVSLELLTKICASVKIPVVAIGGIKEENAAQLVPTGIDGFAVVSAVIAQPDVAEAARRMRKIYENGIIR